jgi:ankyrin repeat protein
MLACRSGDAEAARLLLEAGADRTLPTPDGPPLLEVLDQLSLPDEKEAELRALLA